MRIVSSCALLCLTTFAVAAIPQDSASLPFLALTNANVIDGVSNQPRRQVRVLVRDGKILAVGTTTPEGATIIDLKGRWLLPGLIDAHVHVTDVTAPLPEADPRRRIFTDEELVAAVQAATRAGRAVMAHAHGDEGAAAAVRAGVRSIEHGTYLSDATLTLMKERGTFLVPTITALLRYVATNGPGPEPSVLVTERSKEMLPVLRAVAAKAWGMGVRIVAGCDSTYGDDFQLPNELEELVRAGMSPLDAIKAATSVAAD